MSAERQYFGTDGIRGRVGEYPITPEFALKLGWAVGQALSQGQQGKVVIAQDPRMSSSMLVSALSAGVMAAGLEVCFLGVIPTPGVAYLTRALKAQLGIMVSASHNPYYDNGIKFFSAEGKKLPDLIEKQVESFLALPLTIVEANKLGQSQIIADAANQYIQFCQKTFLPSKNLKEIKLVVDCANGATHLIAPAVFTALGAAVIASHDKPNGLNINEQCGSTHPESLQKAVIDHQADVGIAFDGDGDRVIFVDHRGEIVDGDELLLMIVQFYQAQDILNGGVVGTQMSNLGLEQALKERKIPFVRARVGDRYVLDEMQQKHWVLGGESSGHIICSDKTTTGDGIIAALQVLNYLCLMGKPLHELKKSMTKCAQVLLNVPVKQGVKIVSDPQIEKAVKEAEKRLAETGRILLRPSGTEPLIRIMVEGEDPLLIQSIAEEISQVVSTVAKTME